MSGMCEMKLEREGNGNGKEKEKIDIVRSGERRRTRELWPSGERRPGDGSGVIAACLGIVCRNNRSGISPPAFSPIPPLFFSLLFYRFVSEERETEDCESLICPYECVVFYFYF